MGTWQSDSRKEAVADLALSMAYGPGVPREVVADIAGDTLVAYLTLDEPPQNWEAWVTRVARNKRADYYRALDRRGSRPDDEWRLARDDYRGGRFWRGPSAAGVAGVLVDVVLEDVSERDRELLEAHASGQSNAEIAEQFGLANGATVAATVSRIKRRLRDKFPELADDPGHPRLY